jgi:DNA-binding winged helix-turn-helix (wHTH) protein/Tol biopolymer transport system component
VFFEPLCRVDIDPSVSRLQFGDVTLVPVERLVLRNGQPLSLTPKAFDLLLVLAENPGRLLTKEHLMQAVWADTAVEESNLSYHVFAIRKALGDTAENGQLIETVPKRGYRFTASVTRHDAGTAVDVPVRVPDSERRSSNRTWWRSAAWFASGIACAGGTAALLIMSRTDPLPNLIQAQVSPGVQLSEGSPFALSPDGQQLVFAGRGNDGVSRLWVRRMSDDIARPLSGTESALGGLTPPMFWSPDNQTIAFNGVGQLKRFDLRDDAIRTVCALPNLAVGGSWSVDDVVIVGQPSSGLLRCSLADGQASELTRLDTKNGETAHVLPWFLPDGRHFLYVRVARKAPEGSGVYLGSLDDEPGAPRPMRLLATGFGAAYVPTKGTSTGHVITLRDTTLFAQAFDERTLQLRGDPIPLASPVGSFLDGGFFTTSQTDVIVFRPPDKEFQLMWFDREGRVVGTVGDVGRYSGVALSPDDSRVATARQLVGSAIDQDIWVLETSRRTSTRVTFGSLLEAMPVWSADARRLLYTIDGDVGTLFEQIVDGPPGPRMLLETKLQHKVPTGVSPDGRFLLYTAHNQGGTRGDVWALPLTGEREPFPLIQRDLDQGEAQISPDGRWVAYASNESGRYEVLVQRFIESSDERSSEPATVAVSNGGGSAPRWRRDGRELYFMAPDGSLMAADVTPGPQLSVGPPRALFRLPGSHGDWNVASDGSRFLIAVPMGADASAPFTILWSRLAQIRAVSR